MEVGGTFLPLISNRQDNSMITAPKKRIVHKPNFCLGDALRQTSKPSHVS